MAQNLPPADALAIPEPATYHVRMNSSLVMTVIGADRYRSHVIARHTVNRLPKFLLALICAANASAAALKPAYDIVIAGAGTGGCGAAIEAARLGASVLLLEETDWIGGQMNAAAVTSMDEGKKLVRERGLYREFVAEVEAFYKPLGKSCETAYWNGHICMEPRVGQKILYAMLDKARGSGTLDLSLLSRVTKVVKEGDTVTGVEIETGKESQKIACKILIDATEWGDVIPLTGARYRVGNCTNDAIDLSRRIQDLTWTAVVKEYPQGVPSELLIRDAPPGYTAAVHERFVKSLIPGDKPGYKEKPWTFATFIGYRGMPDSSTTNKSRVITRTHLNYNNDYETRIAEVEVPTNRIATLRAAKLKTLHLLYYIQHTLAKTNWAVANDEGFDSPYNRAEVDAWLKERPDLEPYRATLNHFSVMAYARESRRVIGLHTLTAHEIERKNAKPVQFTNTVALGDYAIDLHGSMTAALIEQDLDGGMVLPKDFGDHGIGPFAISFESFIPEKLDGFLPAEKNISQSRLANGATRLQPSTMLMGQAAGTIAALAISHHVQPRNLDPVIVQKTLLDAGSILQIAPLRDVARSAPEWKAIQLVTVHGMLPLEDGNFTPAKDVSPLELSDIATKLRLRDPAKSSDPVTRTEFASVFDSASVKLRFASSDADRAKPITRSEAAQIIAEFLEKRAIAKMTGEAQTIDWTSVRPAAMASAVDLASGLDADLQQLVDRKIIDSPDYWREHAVKGKTCDGAKAADLILRAAREIDPSATAATAAKTLGENALVSRPEYWAEHAVAGKTCAGESVASLIGNIARHPR